MRKDPEELIKAVYRRWKADLGGRKGSHPKEEDFACFLEGKLSIEDSANMREHLLACDTCSEAIAMQLRINKIEDNAVPDGLIERVKDVVSSHKSVSVLEVALRLKEKALEILSATGDVLVGQELVPGPLLRSRRIDSFADEVNILKDFQDVRVQIKIENKQGEAFGLVVVVKDKATEKIMKDLRVTLIKDDVELESYAGESGKVVFENVLLGKYSVEISAQDKRIASLLLDIKS
jgi:hypothetical protein